MSSFQKLQARPTQRIQTSAMSPSYANTLDAGGGESDLYGAQSLSDESNEDKICLTCIDECTCPPVRSRAMTTSHPPPSGVTHGSLLPPAPSTTSPNGEERTSAPKPSLKIKLTLPPSLQHKLSLPAQSYKKTSKKHSETTSASESVGGELVDSPFSAIGQPLIHGTQFNADGSIKKKRGRPSKAAVAAREAAARAAEAAQGAGIARQDEVIRHRPKQDSHRSVLSARRAQAMKPSKRVSTTSRVRSVPKTQQKKRPLAGAAAASHAAAVYKKQQKKTKRVPVTAHDDESSELSELQDDADSDSRRSIQFPTFISAFSTTSNSSSDSSDSESDSEHRPPPNTLEQESERIRKELFGDNTSPQRRVSHRNNWEIRPRLKSVGAEGTTDDDSESDSDDEEEEEEEEEMEEEDEPADGQEVVREDENIDKLMRYAGITTGYSDDDEESNFDAELFFANLSDSTEDDSDDQMGDVETGFGDDDPHGDDDMDVVMEPTDNFSAFSSMSLPEVAAAGFLAPFEELERRGLDGLPFDLPHGWDNHVLLSGFLKADDNVPVPPVETRRTSSNHSLGFASLFEDADIMMATSEEEEAVAMFENEYSQQSDEDIIEIFEDGDGGETTEDEFVEIDGIATPRNMVDLRFPASLGSINPMSTVSSPIMSPGAAFRHLASPTRSARPADILAGRVPRLEDAAIGNVESSDVAASPDPRGPPMGSFSSKEKPRRRVIVNSNGRIANGEPVPSPYPAIIRMRSRVGVFSEVIGSADVTGGQAPAVHSGPTETPMDSLLSEYFWSPAKSSDLPLTDTIELDDVLNAAFLDADAPGTTTDASCDTDQDTRNKHIQNLRRWDRIPMNTFRKSRVGAGAPLELSIPDKMTAGSWSSPRAPRPADGFSYGSAAGAMLRGSPLNAALYDNGTGGQATPADASGQSADSLQQGKRMTGKGRASVTISPVILPVRDGDRTPTNESQQQQNLLDRSLQQNALLHAANVKSRKQLRKEKKRQRQYVASGSSSTHYHHQHHHQHHHFPNGKGRFSSSMQRSFSGSIPSLSI